MSVERAGSLSRSGGLIFQNLNYQTLEYDRFGVSLRVALYPPVT
jgi:hypothetical protein